MSTTIPRPEVAAPGEWSFPQPRELTLPNGIGGLVHDVPGQYVISVRLTVPVALRHEPEAKEGVAWVMARLLDEGTRTHGQRELSELLERRGIALGAGMSEAALGVDLDVPQRFLGEALELLTECVSEPVFDEGEVSRIVRTRLAEIEQERASAGRRAYKEWAKTYYDPAIRASSRRRSGRERCRRDPRGRRRLPHRARPPRGGNRRRGRRPDWGRRRGAARLDARCLDDVGSCPVGRP